MAAQTSVGDVVVQLLFQTNADEVLGKLTAESLQSKEAIEKLIQSGKGFNVTISDGNRQVQQVLETMRSAREANEALRSTVEKTQAAEKAAGDVTQEASAAKKEFTVTINKQAAEEEKLVGPLVSEGEARQKNIEGLEAEKAARSEVAQAARQSTEAVTAAVQATQGAGEEQLGIVQALKARLVDLKYELERATDPAFITRVTTEMREINAQLQGIKFGTFSEGTGLIQQMELELQQLKAALRAATDPEDVRRLGAEIEELDRKMALASGRSTFIRDFREARIEHQVFNQGLISLMFLLSTFSTENASSETKKLHSTLQGALSTALAFNFGILALAPSLSAFAGPVGLVIGALVGLISYFNDTGDAAKKAAEEGLKEFVDLLGKLPESRRIAITFDIDERLEEAKKKLAAITESVYHPIGQDVEERIKPGHEKEAEQLDKQIAALQERKKANEEASSAEAKLYEERQLNNLLVGDQYRSIGEYESRIKQLKEEQLRIDKEVTYIINGQQVPGAQLIQDVSNKINSLEKERKELVATTSERIADQIKSSEADYQIALNSGKEVSQKKEAYRQILLVSLDQTTDSKEKLSIVQKLKQLNAEILNDLKEQLRHGEITNSQYIKLLQMKEAENANVTERNQIEADISAALKDEISIVERKLQAGSISVQEAQSEVNAIVSLKNERGQTLLTEKEILAIRQQLGQEVRKQLKDEQGIQDEIAQGQVALVTDRYQKQIEGEKLRHETRLRNINVEISEEAAAASPQQKLDRDRLLELEERLHIKNIGTVQTEQEREISRLRIENISKAEDRVRQKYDFEINVHRDMVRTGEETQELADEQIQALRRQQEQELSSIRSSSFESVVTGIERITGSLDQVSQRHSADEKRRIDDEFRQREEAVQRSSGSRTDKEQQLYQLRRQHEQALQDIQNSGMNKMINSFRQILTLAKQINTLVTASQKHQDTTGGVMDIIGSAVGFLALFSEGGKIPGGSFIVREEMSSKYKNTLDLLGASVVQGGIPHKDSVIADSPGGKVALTPNERILPPELAFIGQLMNAGLLNEKHESSIQRYITGKDSRVERFNPQTLFNLLQTDSQTGRNAELSTIIKSWSEKLLTDKSQATNEKSFPAQMSTFLTVIKEMLERGESVTLRMPALERAQDRRVEYQTNLVKDYRELMAGFGAGGVIGTDGATLAPMYYPQIDVQAAVGYAARNDLNVSAVVTELQALREEQVKLRSELAKKDFKPTVNVPSTIKAELPEGTRFKVDVDNGEGFVTKHLPNAQIRVNEKVLP